MKTEYNGKYRRCPHAQVPRGNRNVAICPFDTIPNGKDVLKLLVTLLLTGGCFQNKDCPLEVTECPNVYEKFVCKRFIVEVRGVPAIDANFGTSLFLRVCEPLMRDSK